MSYLSESELLMLNLSDLPRDTPFIIGGVGLTQFNIAKRNGQWKNYAYFPTTEELIREDVVRWLSQTRKKAQKVGAGETAQEAQL